jgi:hypothetical protein
VHAGAVRRTSRPDTVNIPLWRTFCILTSDISWKSGFEMSEGRRKCWLSWSSGKDACYTLHVLLQDPTIEVIIAGQHNGVQRQTMHNQAVGATRSCQVPCLNLRTLHHLTTNMQARACEPTCT